MTTCKDCLHSEVCAYIKPDLPICSDFADRARYVMREKGEWIPLGQRTYGGGRSYTHYCNRCGQHGYDDYVLCPNCGADMTEGTGDETKVLTNADRIRAMTDDELNDLFHDIYDSGAYDAVSYGCGHQTNSFEWTMDWLQQPAEGE